MQNLNRQECQKELIEDTQYSKSQEEQRESQEENMTHVKRRPKRKLEVDFGKFPDPHQRKVSRVEASGKVHGNSKGLDESGRWDEEVPLELLNGGEGVDGQNLFRNSRHLEFQVTFGGFVGMGVERQLEIIVMLVESYPSTKKMVLEGLKLFNAVNHSKYDIWDCPACSTLQLIRKLFHFIEHLDEPTYLAETFHFLGLLARSNQGRERILRCGGFEALIHQMKQTNHSQVLKYICFSLGNIVSGIPPENRQFGSIVVQEEVIPMMMQHLDDAIEREEPELIQQLCFAIGNVAFLGDFEEMVLEMKAIPKILNVLCKYQHEDLLVTDAMFFLKNFAYGEAGRQDILSNDGIRIITTILEVHPKHADLLEIGFTLLFDLTFSGCVTRICENSRTVDIILKALFSFQNNATLICEAIRTIARIYSQCNVEQKKMILQTQIIKALRLSFINYENYEKTLLRYNQERQAKKIELTQVNLSTSNPTIVSTTTSNPSTVVPQPLNSSAPVSSSLPLNQSDSQISTSPQTPSLHPAVSQSISPVELSHSSPVHTPSMNLSLPARLVHSTPTLLHPSRPPHPPLNLSHQSLSTSPILPLAQSNPTLSSAAHVLKRVVNTFNLLSSESVSHHRDPPSKLPSLIELSARALSKLFFGDPQRPQILPSSLRSLPEDLHTLPVHLRRLPRDLLSFLSRASSCDYCRGYYFDHFYESILWTKIPETKSPLPLFRKLCSYRCYSEARKKAFNKQ